MVFIVYIEGVGEVLWLAIDVGPQRHRPTVHFLFHSLLFTVVKECTKQAAVEVIQDGDEEELIKLKGSGKLSHNLPNTVYELHK